MAKSVKEMNQKELQDLVARQDKKLSEQKALIAELNAANKDSAGSKKASVDEVKVDGVKYIIKAKQFKHKGKNYTSADLQANKDLASNLVAIGSGVLKRA